MDDVTRRWTLRLVAGLAAGAVVLSGCSERQEASDTLPGADASPSASEPELPPLGPPDLPMPAEARTQDAAGAEAFVRYYIDLISNAQRTLDSNWIRDLSSGCETCDQLAVGFDEDRASGYARVGGEVRVSSISTPVINGDEAEAAFTLQQGAQRVNKHGTPVTDLNTPERDNLSAGAVLTWQPERQTWLVSRLDVA
ncbi:DUF6318 family protein [Geodermatophilus obscurus]|uniref:DUF6318 family protein n=1 Tax=Geodermatophilus obscurus TaxID=1861 RepID=UPI001140B71F|nr:DUF6318 family protein [Geodermatophilus obscurus]